MHLSTTPSAWVARFVNLVPHGGSVLDLAAGSGRHGRLFLARGCRVLAVDRDVSNLAAAPNLEVLEADIEGGPWPLVGRRFDDVVVTNYLHRPLLPLLVEAVAPGGALIYETFAVNERFGRPRNPDFLLKPGELLEAVRGELTVRAYEHGEVPGAVIQRIAAVRD